MTSAEAELLRRHIEGENERRRQRERIGSRGDQPDAAPSDQMFDRFVSDATNRLQQQGHRGEPYTINVVKIINEPEPYTINVVKIINEPEPEPRTVNVKITRP